MFLQIDAQLLSKRFEVAQVFVVLAFVLDFGFNAYSNLSVNSNGSVSGGLSRTFENPDSCGEIIDSSCCLEGSRDD